MTQAAFPHCDQRILHAPGQCRYCDLYSDRQHERLLSGVAFTGQTPVQGQRPCPADEARPTGTPSWHGHWGGNVARPANEPDELDQWIADEIAKDPELATAIERHEAKHRHPTAHNDAVQTFGRPLPPPLPTEPWQPEHKCPRRLLGLAGRKHTWEKVRIKGHPVYRFCSSCGALAA